MSKTIKTLYYVDMDDNTKGLLMAYPSDKDLRNIETIQEIGEVLHSANFGEKIGICNSIANELVYHGEAETTCSMGRYEFGWEETELYS